MKSKVQEEKESVDKRVLEMEAEVKKLKEERQKLKQSAEVSSHMTGS